MNSTLIPQEAFLVRYEANSDLALVYFSTANAAFVTWNHFLTLDKEAEYLWGRSLPGPRALLLANRYLSLFWAVNRSPWLSSFTSQTGCTVRLFLSYGLEYSQYIAWAGFACLRVFALRKQWACAALVLLLALVPVAIKAAELRYEDTLGGASTCAYRSNVPDRILLNLVLVSRISIILSDAIVVVVTCLVTRDYHQQDILQGFGRKMTLSSVLYKNGAIYFVTLTTMNVVYLAAIVLEDTLDKATSGRISVFLDILDISYVSATSILITNFLFQLQEAAKVLATPSGFLTGTSQGACSTMQFARADVDTWADELHAPQDAQLEEGYGLRARQDVIEV